MVKSKTLILFLLGLIAFAPIKAQDEKVEDDPDNLVPNGSFENYEGRLRRDEQFDLTQAWGNATGIISDLFAKNIKSNYVAIPKNMYGEEEAADGENYAGVVMYSFSSKRPRSYITVELKDELKENTLYCISYKASLAERSKYASNNLGVVISKKSISQKGEGSINNSDALVKGRNKIVNQTDGWWTFCQRYAAKGDEEYLTIGNFASDGRTKSESRTVSSTYEDGPEIAAYYYIDDVQVREIAPNEICACATSKIPESKVIYSGSAQLTDDMTMSEKVGAVHAYFYQYQSGLTASTKRSIDKIIEMMKSNPMMKIQVIGHTDNEEAELAKTESSLQDLSADRAANVREYMASEGVNRTHILMDDKKNTQPDSNMSTPISLAKNRRVEFKIVF